MSLLVWLLKRRPFLLSGCHLHGDAQFLIVTAGGGHFLKGTGEEAARGTGLVLRGPGMGEGIKTCIFVCLYTFLVMITSSTFKYERVS